MERIGSSDAGVRRNLCLSSGSLRARVGGAVRSLSFHLAISAERTARNRIGLHRLRAICRLSLAAPQSIGNPRGDASSRRVDDGTSLSTHRRGWEDSGEFMDRHFADSGSCRILRTISFQSENRIRFSAESVPILPWVFPWPRGSGPRGDLRLPRLLRRLLHRR